jgi:antitoxin MazE
MKLELARIGNSRGIRIPKPLIDQCGFRDAVEVRVVSEGLVIAAVRAPRQGWRDAFSKSAKQDEPLLKGLPENKFDHGEWTW